MVLSQCEPVAVFHFFEAISQIPRGSGNEKAVSDYILAFAREKGLEAVQDERNNLIIYKPGSQGYEHHAPIILQGHMDMVCEKNKDTVHDFMKDPIKLKIDGDLLCAEGTTLGGDNGIAVAFGMALLDADDIKHPPLEVVFTTDEEAGMSGAEHLDAALLKGRRMINMDTDVEGTFFTGCAGGTRITFLLPAEKEPVSHKAAFKLEIKGLKGGHSGIEIHHERGNSIRLLARLLRALMNEIDIRVADFSGGMKLNAIPREAEAVILLNPEDTIRAEAVVEAFRKDTAIEYRVSDPGLLISFTRTENEYEQVLTSAITAKAIAAILLIPNGVLGMSRDIPGLVETSGNVGVLAVNEQEISITYMPRSSVASQMQMTVEQVKMLGDLMKAKVICSHAYPAWAYDPDSKLRQTAVALYQKLNGKEPTVTAVHAGLECGILGGKIPGLDMISFGPNAWDLHNPDESLSISSTKRIWAFLLALLEEL